MGLIIGSKSFPKPSIKFVALISSMQIKKGSKAGKTLFAQSIKPVWALLNELSEKDTSNIKKITIVIGKIYFFIFMIFILILLKGIIMKRIEVNIKNNKYNIKSPIRNIFMWRENMIKLIQVYEKDCKLCNF